MVGRGATVSCHFNAARTCGSKRPSAPRGAGCRCRRAKPRHLDCWNWQRYPKTPCSGQSQPGLSSARRGWRRRTPRPGRCARSRQRHLQGARDYCIPSRAVGIAPRHAHHEVDHRRTDAGRPRPACQKFFPARPASRRRWCWHTNAWPCRRAYSCGTAPRRNRLRACAGKPRPCRR